MCSAFPLMSDKKSEEDWVEEEDLPHQNIFPISCMRDLQFKFFFTNINNNFSIAKYTTRK